jgi:hypothetical protein
MSLVERLRTANDRVAHLYMAEAADEIENLHDRLTTETNVKDMCLETIERLEGAMNASYEPGCDCECCDIVREALNKEQTCNHGYAINTGCLACDKEQT